MSSTGFFIVGLLGWAGFWFLLGCALSKVAANADRISKADERRYIPTEEGIRMARSLDDWSSR